MRQQTDLVVQGSRLTQRRLESLAAASGARGSRRLGPAAARLFDVTPSAAVGPQCDAWRLDHAFVPAGARLEDFGLVAMDMDSTLIEIECIDELAAVAGMKTEVADITRRAMLGELDYAQSLRRRVALLAELDVAALERVYAERVRLSAGAERLVGELKSRGLRSMLVSGGFSYFTDRLKQRLGLDYAAGNTPEIRAGRLSGALTGPIIDAQGKAECVRAIRETLALTRDQVIVIGDGANDLAMMADAGISIAYRAKPAVQQRATYRLNHSGIDGLLNLFL